MTLTQDRWTNASVKRLAGEDDPVEVITKKARGLVLAAMDSGWSGPPFDPLLLSDFIKLQVVPRGDLRDARIVPAGDGFCIEYNPTRPRSRVRYSIAHEIAHTLFPDCSDQIRNRAAPREIRNDEWQLEALCNIAAAEFLMPMGSLGQLTPQDLGIDNLLELRQKYDVSTEAILIRAVHAVNWPCAVFSASRIESPGGQTEYRLDYVIGSNAWRVATGRGARLSGLNIISQCSAIGYTAKGTERIGGTDLHVECIGIPPYPGSTFPRVTGILTPSGEAESGAAITFVRGDALEPRGKGRKLIVHVVNDATPNWGGRGFAQALRRKWPAVQESFIQWATMGTGALSLGHVHMERLDDDLTVASMVCQRGYGASPRTRLRYAALESCLFTVAREAQERAASVHMPRIGCGEAGGSWQLVQELITSILLVSDVPVFVYDLPGADLPQQSALPFQATH
jgi:O-acetyl-ADP-ribose deacetylase (regulator of RNase III)